MGLYNFKRITLGFRYIDHCLDMRIFIEKDYLSAYHEKLTQTFISSCSLQRQSHALTAESFLRGKQRLSPGSGGNFAFTFNFSQNCFFFLSHSTKCVNVALGYSNNSKLDKASTNFFFLGRLKGNAACRTRI